MCKFLGPELNDGRQNREVARHSCLETPPPVTGAALLRSGAEFCEVTGRITPGIGIVIRCASKPLSQAAQPDSQLPDR